MCSNYSGKRLRLVEKPFDDPDYIFELKHDGFRAVVYLYNGQCKLVSRNMKPLRFDSLRAELAKLPALDAILDGEIVSLDKQGVSRFNDLLSKKVRPVFYAFDLIWLNGEDLRQEPLIERKQRVRGEFLLMPRLACERVHDNGHANDTISRSRRR
jgi:bifunctional non-homologous end joining protein LigD